MVNSKILEVDSGRPGPSLAIFAGIHGNELAGVYALQNLLPVLKPTKGKVFVAFANPDAIKANTRMLTKNLNRCFMAGNDGQAPEDKRARELMKVLDVCDALLDLHMFYDDDGEPFAICEGNAINIAKKFDVDIISTNWSEAEPGAADGYMYATGKVGLCVECGPISKAKEYTAFAEKVIYQFLQYFEMSPKKVAYSGKPKRLVAAEKSVYKPSADFKLREGYKNFSKLVPGEVIAREGRREYKAGAGECIIFPHYTARIGEEAYIVGKDL